MRTTIRLDDQVFHDAKQVAAQTGRTLTAVIEEALREALARRAVGPPRKRAKLPTFGGRGPLPGVDLDDSASLLDLMEARHAPG